MRDSEIAKLLTFFGLLSSPMVDRQGDERMSQRMIICGVLTMEGYLPKIRKDRQESCHSRLGNRGIIELFRTLVKSDGKRKWRRKDEQDHMRGA